MLMDVDTLDFEIAVQRGPDGARVSVLGELDLATADELRIALETEMAAAHDVVLDLERVEFMDSTGLTVILRAMESARQNGRAFGIRARVSAAAQRTFSVAGVLPMLPLVEQ